MADAILASTRDYDIALLRFLATLPGGQGETAEVCRLFEEAHGDRIPAADREWRSNVNQPIWYNNLCWSRAVLKEVGFLDMPRRGVWRITEAGRKWVAENPSATRITGVEKVAPAKVPRESPTRTHAESPAKLRAAPGITVDMLEQTRQVMPAEQFRQVWGTLYDQLLAEERAKQITVIAQGELARRARQRLDEVHAFLQGKNTSSPSGEMLCDWIHFCYALDLHREAAALLHYVREAEVDPAIYRRAKRVAEACRSKLLG